MKKEGGGGASAKRRPAPADKRVRRTEDAMTKAFFRLLEKTDYDKITISALSREAGIDRKTFYLHYSSIAELADELLRDRARIMVKSLVAGAKARQGDPEGTPFHVGDLMASMWGELSDDMSSIRSQVRHLPSTMVLDRLPELLSEAFMEEGCFAYGMPKQHEQLCVTFVGSGLVALFRRWVLFGDGKIPEKEASDLVETLVFDGLNGVAKTVPARLAPGAAPA